MKIFELLQIEKQEQKLKKWHTLRVWSASGCLEEANTLRKKGLLGKYGEKKDRGTGKRRWLLELYS